MIVQGHEIPEAAIAAAERVIASMPEFELWDVQKALCNAGIPVRDGIANRVADRLLQKARRDGRIRFERGRWRPVSPG